MGNPVNIFDLEGDDLTAFLATAVSNGTYSDLLDDLKVDANGQAATATGIASAAGKLWANMVDDYIKATYPIVRNAALGLAGDAGITDGVDINGTDYQSSLKVSNIGGANAAQLLLHRHSTTLAPAILSARSHSDTSAHTVVSDGDGLFEVYAAGWDGTDYAFGGYLGFEVSGTPGSDDMPTRFVVSVAADGSQTLTERLTISPAGAVTITGATTITGVTQITGATTVTGALAVSANVTPVVDGTGTLGTSALGWDVVWLKERDSAALSGVAGHGAYVVDDSAPSAAVFVSDDDTKRNMSRMPTIHMPAASCQTTGTITYNATSYLGYVTMADAATTYAFWSVALPPTYGGQALTLRVKWAGDTSLVGNVRFQYNIRRFVDGELGNALNGSSVNVTVAANGTALTQQTDNLSASVGVDSAVAGESIRVRIGRLGTDGADTYTGGIVFIYAVELIETVT